MDTQVIDAVYEKGVFRPLNPPMDTLGIHEGQRVRLVVKQEQQDVLALASYVFAGLTPTEIDEIENIALTRRPFFDRPEAP